jgi:hypothetical protein
MRFLDVKTDYAFKRVFGSEGSKPVLMSFLNAILDYRGEQAIVDLTIVDPYPIPLLLGMKDTCDYRNAGAECGRLRETHPP